MRLWSIHPAYLDTKGLVALWREGLLAQMVLLGKTRGYKNHPQLLRFRNTVNPSGAIAGYLREVAKEADVRGYNFDKNRIGGRRYQGKIPVTRGQAGYEFRHLMKKLKTRDPVRYKQLKNVKKIRLHPMFIEVKGNVESWEKI